MDMIAFGLLGILFVLISCVLAIISFIKIGRLQRQFDALHSYVHSAKLAEPTVKSISTIQAEKPPEPIEVQTPTIAKTALPEPKKQEPIKPQRNVENALATSWFVWIGGAAVALAGLLMIKYAHDHGLIPPVLRILFGLVFAAALVWAGERVRKSRPETVADYVPAALSAAGLVTAFGSIYAAHALYDLIPGAVSFIGLGLVALGAFALSRLQGPLIAALGLLGAYIAPMLITSNDPNAWTFFPYIFVILAASIYTLRGRNWWWLGYLAIAGALAWSMLWINEGPFEMADVLPVGLFALALGAASTLLLEGKKIFSDESGNLSSPKNMSNPLRLAFCGMASASTILAAQILQSRYAFVALIVFATGMTLITAFSWFKKGWTGATLAAALLTFSVLFIWPEVSTQNWAMDESGMWSTVPGLIAPPLFRNWMFLALAAFGGIGAYGYLRKTVASPWAILAASSSFMFLFGSWARVDFLMANSVWAITAMILAAALTSLAFVRRNTSDQISAGALLTGAALLALFAFDRLFDDIWFTLSIAILAAAFAWISRILPTRAVGWISSALGSFAALRLFVGREFWGNYADLPLGPHWALYGYGLTAALLLWASRQLNDENFRRHKVALEGISLGLIISLISKELRVLIGGGIDQDHMTLLEISSHILAWLSAAYGLIYRQQLFSSFISLWGSRILLAGSCAAMIGMSLLSLNPLATGEAIEGNVGINTLWLAYVAPVALLAMIARKMENLGWSKWRNAIGLLALVLVVTFVTLQTKRVFQGRFLIPEFSSDAESYALSASWLVTSIALFVAGLKLNRQTIRYGGMAVMILALLKTFGYDLWQLGGIWQIASVLGIGLSLIGMGWLYTRFVRMEIKNNDIK
jgi:uncharacterized membrane protein